MRTVGLVPLSIIEVKPGLHERAEGITRKPTYRISWPKKTVSLFGRWKILGAKRGSGNYIRAPVQQVSIPPGANKQYRLAKKDDQVQEVAAFLGTHLTETRIDIILAARIADDWFELYRGSSSWRQLGFSEATVRDG